MNFPLMRLCARSAVRVRSVSCVNRISAVPWFVPGRQLRLCHRVDDYRVLNEDGLRFEDEFVRTKCSMRSVTCSCVVTILLVLYRL